MFLDIARTASLSLYISLLGFTLKKKNLVVALFASALLMGSVLSGCVSSDPDSASHSTEKAASGPHFTGPWADEFTSLYRKTTTSFERKVLADGTITDSELAEMQNKFKTCLEDKGITFSGFNADGSFGFNFPPSMDSAKANKIADDCSATSGDNTIGALYFQIKRNPQHLDEAAIMAACLVKEKVVPPSYSAKQYNKDAPNTTFPFYSKTEGQKVLEKCSADPLGLSGR